MPKESSKGPTRRRLPSLLTARLRHFLAAVVGLAVLMLANTTYLVITRLGDAVGWDWLTGGPNALPAIFQGMVLSHTGLGIILVGVLIAFVVTHLPRVWARQHGTSIVSGVGVVLCGVLLLVTGLLILTDAASRDNQWAWWSHVLAAALAPVGYLVHRLVSHSPPLPGAIRRGVGVVAGLAGLLLVVHVVTASPDLTPQARRALAAELDTGPGGVNRTVSDHLDDAFVPLGAVPPSSPFFPSPATTSSGALLEPALLIPELGRLNVTAVRDEALAQGFVSDIAIGAESCIRCHPDVTAQWEDSAHRFSSFNNPFYEATILSIQDQSGTTDPWMNEHLQIFSLPDEAVGPVKTRWCGACHDPALLFVGSQLEFDRTEAAAQAGLTCMACHAIEKNHDRTGNGGYNLSDLRGDPYLFADAQPDGLLSGLHDAALKAKPTVHKRMLLKPLFKRSEYCLSCHKVSLSEPVNEYRWLRGQNEFDNWDDSGVALNASRTFYLPPTRRVCQDCHMPAEPAPLGDLAADDGLVRSHRFLAANTALPYLRGDTATIRRIEGFLSDEKLRVDVFALRSAANGRTIMGLANGVATVSPGERVRIDVVVRNLGVGHTFPGGTNDSNEGWLELTLLAEDGSVLARSGAVAADGHLDPSAHLFKAVLIDSRGEAIHDRNGARIHATAAVNVIGPGSSDVAQYGLTFPAWLDGRTVRVQARLLWRKFDRRYTEFAYDINPDGFARFDRAPDLPITEIAADEVTIRIGDDDVGATSGPASDRFPWQRFNDYGIALLLQGNTREARAAFERVAADVEGAFEGRLNLARAALRDGNLPLAYEHLDRVETIRPGQPRAAWVWAGVLQEDGRYEEAADAYQHVLESFPGDRAAWRNLGRTYYLDQRYEDALEAFARVLEIDPEDRVSHYHTMLSLRALGREAEADHAELAYERYRIDEAAQSVTRAFREANPGVNLMAQPIHTHELVISR